MSRVWNVRRPSRSGLQTSPRRSKNSQTFSSPHATTTTTRAAYAFFRRSCMVCSHRGTISGNQRPRSLTPYSTRRSASVIAPPTGRRYRTRSLTRCEADQEPRGSYSCRRQAPTSTPSSSVRSTRPPPPTRSGYDAL